MTRELKIEMVSNILYRGCPVEDRVAPLPWISEISKRILDAIEPPEIEIGIWGKAWDCSENNCVYGKLKAYSPDAYLKYQLFTVNFQHFKPIHGLKEAIDELDR